MDWALAHACNPIYLGDKDQDDLSSRTARQIVQETLSQKYPTQKRAAEIAQVVECLPSKHEALVLSNINKYICVYVFLNICIFKNHKYLLTPCGIPLFLERSIWETLAYVESRERPG
jgi:hypothetical protein